MNLIKKIFYRCTNREVPSKKGTDKKHRYTLKINLKDGNPLGAVESRDEKEEMDKVWTAFSAWYDDETADPIYRMVGSDFLYVIDKENIRDYKVTYSYY